MLLSPPFWNSLGTTVEISDLHQETFRVFIPGVPEWWTHMYFECLMYLSYCCNPILYMWMLNTSIYLCQRLQESVNIRKNKRNMREVTPYAYFNHPRPPLLSVSSQCRTQTHTDRVTLHCARDDKKTQSEIWLFISLFSYSPGGAYNLSCVMSWISHWCKSVVIYHKVQYNVRHLYKSNLVNNGKYDKYYLPFPDCTYSLHCKNVSFIAPVCTRNKHSFHTPGR